MSSSLCLELSFATHTYVKRMNYVVKSDVWTLIIPEIVPST